MQTESISKCILIGRKIDIILKGGLLPPFTLYSLERCGQAASGVVGSAATSVAGFIYCESKVGLNAECHG